MRTASNRAVASVWFPSANSSPSSRGRLFCFAHAGGGASLFARWQRCLPPDIAVIACHLPGHEERLREPAIERMEHLLDAMMPALTPLLDRPFGIFGHSLGAWIGYGVARRLRRIGAPMPLRLGVSSCRAPHLPSQLSALHDLPTATMLTEVQRRYDPIPEPILRSRELLDLFLRVLRSDFALFETTSFSTEPPLSCPISAYGGSDDAVVTAADLRAWAEHTAAPGFQFQPLKGGHHYIRDLPDALFREISAWWLP